ncbi:hypothetical protein CDD81_696 [Ophiocordyceps australis]|uniref:3-hydroxyacyl-CoA dehydrogenase NAD binding domain-containing protein n=1 Tax=Ophiocordyceps australis TaxID=1399860 RepID=A0A2C5Y0J2_9HYPO|nr:hypothetical protein CDD81_696 [Ophiocordyceps australis]
MSTIRTVGVVGTGVIGSSWIGLFLAHGLQVLVSDPAPDAEQKLADYLKRIWPTLEDIGLESGASISNYKFIGATLDGYLDKVDFIQENAPERVDLKAKLIGELDAGTRPGVIIASSSSGLPSSQFISECTKNNGRVLIGHPFNPPHLMPLVEVVPHPKTDHKVVEEAMTFYRFLHRTPVYICKEVPGFIANRLQAALCCEVYSLVSRGVVSAKDIDQCVTASLGIRWAAVGPLMANAFGGGGGVEGFKHMAQHLGPVTKLWLEDMRKNRFEPTPENTESLIASVAEEMKACNSDKTEQERDKFTVQTIKWKRAIAEGINIQ